MIELPATYLAQPRWWHGGSEWLGDLPRRVQEQCRRWQLEADGEVMHGSNALVVPVRRGQARFVLRLTPPEDDVAAEVAALRFWDGRGVVLLLEADPGAGAMLLERLDATRSLQRLPLDEAVPVLGQLMRRLAVPAPAEVRSTADVAGVRRSTFPAEWERLGRPFPAAALSRAVACATELSSTTSTLAVNGDLHYEQVLAGGRERWLCVDPVLLRGDIEYDLARILWSRLDEMTDADVHRHVATVVDAAGLDSDRASTWVFFRAVDYWLWGLDRGLTEDPVRCARLVSLFG
jgi:streptomycin 6-kinase